MPLALRYFSNLCFWAIVVAAPMLRAQNYDEYDCRVGRSDVAFIDVFEQLANGLEYNEDGVVVPAQGKRLQLTADTKIAFFHYVASVRPTVTLKTRNRCTSCNGSGGTRRRLDRSFGDYNLGNIVEGVKCESCNGNGFSVGYVSCVVTFRGELPTLAESPRAKEMKRKLYLAQEGDAQAQYEVGLFYRLGKGFKRDLNLAREWLTKSAIQGESRAIPELAELYCDPSSSYYDRAFGLSLFYATGNNNLNSYKKKGLSRALSEVTPATKLEALRECLDEMEAIVLGPRIKEVLNHKKEIASVLDPESARKSFPLVKNNILPDPKDSQAVLKTGISKYFGLGYAKADKDEGMRLIEDAASKSNSFAFTIIALHFDAGVFYQQSDSTAWSYYYVARKLGYNDDYCVGRANSLEYSDIGSDWAGYPEMVFQYFKSGKLDSAFIRRSQDLSICRFLPKRNATPVSLTAPLVNTISSSPISSAQGIEFAKSIIRSKYNQAEFFDGESFSCQKYSDANSIYYYTVAGVVTKSNGNGVSIPSTFLVSFKIANSTEAPSLLYCMVFGTREGSIHVQTSATQ
jgi:TPR repeat protein